MPTLAILFEFDPVLRLTDDLAVRWHTLGLAGLLFAVLLVVGGWARSSGLRADDALVIAIGVVPGAVIAGRLGYALVRPEAFAAGPATILDPAVGGVDLAAGLAGGLATGASVALLLGAPLGRWARLAAVPVLVLLGGGKLAMAAGGSGQGLPSDVAWATGYLGPGPWGSLAPDLPSHPAQLYEGLATLGLAAVLAILLAVRRARARPSDGRVLLVAVAGWALIRLVVSTTWRDPVALAPLPPAGWLAAALAVAALVGLVVLTRRRTSSGDPVGSDDTHGPAWPDPATRPPF